MRQTTTVSPSAMIYSAPEALNKNKTVKLSWIGLIFELRFCCSKDTLAMLFGIIYMNKKEYWSIPPWGLYSQVLPLISKWIWIETFWHIRRKTFVVCSVGFEMRGVILYSPVLAKPFSTRVQIEIVSMHFIRITNGHMVFFFFFFFNKLTMGDLLFRSP